MTMTRWVRTAEGFAANLDGSDAAANVTFPRLEIRSGPAGWECRCLLADGTAADVHGGQGSTRAAQAAVVERARALLGPAWTAALDGLAG